MTKLQFYSYLYGFFGTDGHAKTYKDKISGIVLEVSIKDEVSIQKILENLSNSSISYRTRDTNFKKNHSTIILYCFDKDLLNFLEENDFPIKNKTDNIHVPTQQYDEKYFWLGVIDGDGSIGIKQKDNSPFINLTTKSTSLKESYCDYIEKLTNFRPKSNRNKRDNIYNITLHKEKAVIVSTSLYKDAEICLDRKYNVWLNIKDYKNIRLRRHIWTEQEVKDAVSLSEEEFLNKYPEIGISRLKSKLYRMNNN